uniref:CSON004522 protein n=1 Tax=Culicoides sonorensis TaxID=179676 RepID=A0A336MP18_CULSO
MIDDEHNMELDWINCKQLKQFKKNNGEKNPATRRNALTTRDNLCSITPNLYIVNAKATTPDSLLVEPFVQQLCAILEPDPQSIYNTI